MKIVLTFFFDISYVSTLGLFVLALDCTYSDSPIVSEVGGLLPGLLAGLACLQVQDLHGLAPRVLSRCS